MKLTRTKALLVLAIAAILVSIPAIVSAQELPHTIFGLAYIDGRLAPENTNVQAFIDGNEVGDPFVVENPGVFFLVIPPSTTDASHSNKTITFQVRGLVATQTTTWASAGNTRSFDLNVSTARATNTPTPTRTRTPTPTATPRRTVASAGPTIIQGPRGATGLRGEQGPQGVEGPSGEQGPQGVRGLEGPPGDQGPQGFEGPRGEQGPQGYLGQTGPQGVAGPAGSTGTQGPAGPPGSSGNFLIAIIALVISLLALLVAIGRWIWELQTG